MAKSPNDLIKISNKQTTLVVAPYIMPITNEEVKDGGNILQLFSKYSRYQFTLISHEETSKQKYVSANLDLKSLDLLVKKTDSITNMRMQHSLKPKNPMFERPAYKVEIKGKDSTGKDFPKGATAASLLLSGVSTQELVRHQNFLMNNTNPRFLKNNKAMAEAITDAIGLYNARQLIMPQNLVISLMDIFKVPAASVVKNGEMTKCISLKIYGNINNEVENPYTIIISNCIAPAIVHDDGTVIANLKSAKDNIEYSMNITETQWVHLMSEMMELKISMKNYYAPQAILTVNKTIEYNRTEYRKNPTT